MAIDVDVAPAAPGLRPGRPGSGFAPAWAGPDLWLRDDPTTTGREPWSGRFWDSPDLWCRHVDDGGTEHQMPQAGGDNVFYARVRNRGRATARHFVVTFAVRSHARVEFSYPADWQPCVTAVAGFDLAPGQARVVAGRWPRALVPPPGTHACWLASVLTRGDQPQAGGWTWERNNLAQKNLVGVELQPDRWSTVPLVVPPGAGRRPTVLELRRPPTAPGLEAALASPSSWQPPADLALGFGPGERAEVRLPSRSDPLTLGLALRMPAEVTGGFTVDLVRREADGDRRVLGGVAVQVRPG